jgi:AcrR family transcriptional regulator
MLDRRHLAAALESSSSSLSASCARAGAADEPAGRRKIARLDPRRRILDALVETVAQRGYDRTTVERVLHVADVPAPVFGEHFEDKQDCLLQALDELIGQLEFVVLERASGAAPWPERIRLGLQTLLGALACNPDGARVALVECLSAGEAAVARLRAALGAFVPILEQGRAVAASTEHLPPQASEAVVGGIAAILHRRVLEGRTAELPALLPDLVYFALMPYLGHHRALRAAGLAPALQRV